MTPSDTSPEDDWEDDWADNGIRVAHAVLWALMLMIVLILFFTTVT